MRAPHRMSPRVAKPTKQYRLSLLQQIQLPVGSLQSIPNTLRIGGDRLACPTASPPPSVSVVIRWLPPQHHQQPPWALAMTHNISVNPFFLNESSLIVQMFVTNLPQRITKLLSCRLFLGASNQLCCCCQGVLNKQIGGRKSYLEINCAVVNCLNCR